MTQTISKYGNKSRQPGWHNESARYSLAAKGIKTGKINYAKLCSTKLHCRGILRAEGKSLPAQKSVKTNALDYKNNVPDGFILPSGWAPIEFSPDVEYPGIQELGKFKNTRTGEIVTVANETGHENPGPIVTSSINNDESYDVIATPRQTGRDGQIAAFMKAKKYMERKKDRSTYKFI